MGRITPPQASQLLQLLRFMPMGYSQLYGSLNCNGIEGISRYQNVTPPLEKPVCLIDEGKRSFKLD